LADVRAENFAERPVNQMRGGVLAEIARRRTTSTASSALAPAETADVPSAHLVQMAAGFVFHAIGEVDEMTVDECGAGVAGLAAHFGVEGRLVEDEERVLVGGDDVDQLRVSVELLVA